MNEAYQEFLKKEAIRIAQGIDEMKAEAGWFGQARRIVYLFNRLVEIEAQIAALVQTYSEICCEDRPYLERHGVGLRIKELQKVHKKLLNDFDEVSLLNKTISRVMDIEIKRAREYPIENLLEVNKQGYALCINHVDTRPSMFTRGNFCYCFSCGYSADIIALYMKLNNCSFIDAVQKLGSGSV